MISPRPIMLAIAFILITGIAIYIGRHFVVGDLVERLVRDANAIVGAPRVRRLHVDKPLPGTLGQALTRHLPAIAEARKTQSPDEASQAALRAVLEGERPLHDVPAPYLESLSILRTDLDGVLAGSRAELADLASVEDGFEPAPGTSWSDVLFATSLAALRARQAVAAGQLVEATDDCLDGLALGRDAAIAGGLIGHMVSLKIVEEFLPVCSLVLQSLSDASRTETVGRLRSIREAMPGFERTMREEALWMQLYLRGPLLGEDFRDRLTARPKLMAKGFGAAMNEQSWPKRLLLRALWRDYVDLSDELVAVSAMQGCERDAAFESLARKTENRMSFRAEMLPEPRGYLRFAQRAESGLLRFDLIFVAAAAKAYRSQHGAWPTSVGALADLGLLTAEERHRVASAKLTSEGDGLIISIPLTFQLEDAPSEARVRLRGPANPE